MADKYETLMNHQKIYMTVFLLRGIFLAECISGCFGVVLMTMI